MLRCMMWIRLTAALLFIGTNLALARYLLKISFPRLWNPKLRKGVRSILILAFLGFGVFALGTLLKVVEMCFLGLIVFSPITVSASLLVFSAPLWALPRALMRRRAQEGAKQEVNQSRRKLFSQTFDHGTKAIPLMAATVGPMGTLAALTGPRLKKVRLEFDHLPDALNGLRILHLTDVHLGIFIDTDQIKAALNLGRPHKPDLIALTGDIADEFDLLKPCLDLIEAENAPLGSFACIGNHEIYRGRKRCEAIHQKSNTPLLKNEGRVLDVNGARLFVAGIDDPARLGQDHHSFLKSCIQKAAKTCPENVDFRLLLAHRPESFESASEHQFDLTLSGHTHGSQISFRGRSLFEAVAPRSYLLGHYQKGASHLHTSAGLGHWFPLRINCPCEVVLIELAQKPSPAAKSA